ncbi:hypothetical protein DICA0_B13278 [Diutina catenulata]
MKLQFLLLAPAVMAIYPDFYVTKAGEVKVIVLYKGPPEKADEYYKSGKCDDLESGNIEWNEGWEEKAVFGRFRSHDDVFFNLWPKDDNRWELFEENGDGKRVGRCYRYPEGTKYCGEQPYARCTFFGKWEDEQAKRDVENGEQGEIVEMLES